MENKTKKQELTEFLLTTEDVIHFSVIYTAKDDTDLKPNPRMITTQRPLAARLAMMVESDVLTTDEMMKLSNILDKATKRLVTGIEEADVVEDEPKEDNPAESITGPEEGTKDDTFTKQVS